VVKNGILLITIREKVDLALLNTVTFGEAQISQELHERGPYKPAQLEEWT
jgi:hypothetical protein